MTEPRNSGHHRLANTFNFRVTLRRSVGPPMRTVASCEKDPERSRPQTVAGAVETPQGDPEVLGDGGFQECNGLEIEMDAQELQEGGRNDGVVRLLGRGRYTNLVLRRGLFFAEDGGVNPEFWQWLQAGLSGERRPLRYDGTIEVLDDGGGRALATWTFTRGLPVKLSGPALNARTGEVAVEELHIAHEGLRLEP